MDKYLKAVNYVLTETAIGFVAGLLLIFVILGLLLLLITVIFTVYGFWSGVAFLVIGSISVIGGMTVYYVKKEKKHYAKYR